MSYLDRLFALSGKTAVVLGGGGHLCSAMSHGLAKAGVRVAVADIRLEKARTVADAINAAGGTAIPVECDASNLESHQACRQAVLDELEHVDILINGAGINAPTPVLDITAQEFRDIVDSHLLATLLGCQVYGPGMIERGNGSIINLSSASAGPPLSKAFTYSAAKAGVLNLTQNLAREWATAGVRVNALRPGFFPTEWSQKNFIDADRQKAIHGHTPMGRYGEPDELIGAVLWLASDASGFVTGAQIAVDGGFSCMSI